LQFLSNIFIIDCITNVVLRFVLSIHQGIRISREYRMGIFGCLWGTNSILFDFTADLCHPQNICKAKQHVFVFKAKDKVLPVQTLKAYGGSKA